MKKQQKVSSITAKKQLSIGRQMLKTSWRIRPLAVTYYFLGAAMEIGGFIMSIYATAQLGALLAAFVTTGKTDSIWFWLWLDITAAAVTGLGFFIMAVASRLLYFAVVRWSTNTFLATLCRLDLADYYDEDMRNEINKVASSYAWRMSALTSEILELLYAIMRFVVITIIVAQITWWLIPLIALFLVPTLLAESRLAKLQWFVWDIKGDQRHVFWGLDWILRQAKGQMELRSTQASQYVLHKIDHMNDDFYQEQEKKYKHANRLIVPTKLLEVAGTAIGAIVLLIQFLARQITLDKYFFLSGALLRIGGALNTIFGTISRMQESLLFAGSFFAIAERQAQLIDQPNATKLPAKTVPDIVFEDVTFTYPGQQTPVFEDLNLKLQAGEHVALVGENGAGKSTLIKLLLRFYRPDSGRILINGNDLQDIDIDSWYKQLATLFQDFNQYPLPIDENITIGQPDTKPNKKLLEQAARFSGVDDMVAKYKHGWQTVLDSSFKKGIEPSGGQWQRVAIGRAFYRQANVIILDEPTSAIDAKAEYHIFNSIFNHYKSKTALIVSHRFSTVRRADRIIVLEGGKIIEQGNHHELMTKAGLYRDLFSKQAEGYK